MLVALVRMLMSGRGTLKGPPVQNTDHEVKYQCVVNFHVYGWRGGAVAGAECGAMPKEAANELFWWKCGPVPRPHSYELVEEPPLWETPPGPPHMTTSPYLPTATDHRTDTAECCCTEPVRSHPSYGHMECDRRRVKTSPRLNYR